MTLNFFGATINDYTPEAGPMTLGDAAEDAWNGSKVFIGSGRSAAQAWQAQRFGNELLIWVSYLSREE
jgi:hypothetical protein